MYGENFEVKPESLSPDEDEDAGLQDPDYVDVKDFEDLHFQMTSRHEVNSAVIRNRGSLVWRFFFPRRTCAICKLCRKSLKRSGGNTTNLAQHLKRSHRKQHAIMLEEYRRRGRKVLTSDISLV